jgi:hemolysin activation/secretion protein
MTTGSLIAAASFLCKIRPKGTAARLIVFLCLLPCLLLSSEAPRAQSTSVPQPRPSDLLPALPDLKDVPPDPDLILPEIPEPPEETPAPSGPAFFLNSVRFEGNTVFTNTELQAVAMPFLGRDIAAEGLESLRRALTEHYVSAGYINSGAVLPDQRIIDGAVLYIIVEGELTDIDVEGNERLPSDYLVSRIRLSTGPPLNVNDLQRGLRILLDDPLIRRIDSELLPGLHPGESRLLVRVEETEPFGLTAFTDNAIQPSVGGKQIGSTLTLRNLSGFGEIVTVKPSLAEGYFEIETLAEVPITKWDTRLGLRFDYTKSKVIEDPFDDLDIESDTYELGINFSQPVYRAPGESLTAGLGFDYTRNTTYLLGNRFSFSDGVDNGRSEVSAFRGALDWLQRSQTHVLAVNSLSSLGVDLFGATDNSGSTPDSQFFAWLGQAQLVYRLDEADNRIVLRGEGQWTDDRLLPVEKFGVGGLYSVRGYREDLQLGDKGWSSSIEARIPILDLDLPSVPADKADGRLELIPFFDMGRAWDNQGPKPDLLASIGVGLGWAITKDVQANIYYGYALQGFPGPEDKDLQDHGINFSVTARLY